MSIKPKKQRWRKQFAHLVPKAARADKFTYRGDGEGKIEFLVDGRPLFKVGPVAVDRGRARG